MTCLSAAVSDAASALTNAALSATFGRSTSFGGISPDCTRSCTLTQFWKLPESFGAYLSVAKSSPPSRSTSLWQLEQYFLANPKNSASTACATQRDGLARTAPTSPDSKRNKTQRQ